MYYQSPAATPGRMSPIPYRTRSDLQRMHPINNSDVHLSAVRLRTVTPNPYLATPTNMVRIPSMERIPIVDPTLMKPDLHHGTGRISSSEWMLMNPEDLDNFSSDMMKSLLDEEEKEKSVRLEWPPVDPAKQTEAGEHTFSTAKKPSKKKGRRLGEDCEPTEHDVLFGKGGRINQHPGNIKLREKVQAFLSVYDGSDKRTKTAISWSILEEIKREGARFLEKGGDGKWRQVINDKAARMKISQALREKRARATSNVSLNKTMRII